MISLRTTRGGRLVRTVLDHQFLHSPVQQLCGPHFVPRRAGKLMHPAKLPELFAAAPDIPILFSVERHLYKRPWEQVATYITGSGPGVMHIASGAPGYIDRFVPAGGSMFSAIGLPIAATAPAAPENVDRELAKICSVAREHLYAPVAAVRNVNVSFSSTASACGVLN